MVPAQKSESTASRIKPWLLKQSKTVLQTRPFKVLEKLYMKPDGITPFTASVLNCSNWVNIIALSPEGKILLEYQYRFGTDRIELEIPGGVIEPNEDPLSAAKRELKEETGFISDNWEFLGVVDTNPAILSNKCFTYCCSNIHSTGETHFDPDEDIEYLFKSVKDVRADIRNGVITNAYILAAFHWFALKTELI